MNRVDEKEPRVMNIMQRYEREQLRMDLPTFRGGDTVRVHVRIIEGEKERIQVFQGVVIKMCRGTTNATFTVRKVSDGVGVERVFPYHSPFIEKIDIISEGKVRQSRIYYLRNLKGKASRIKTRNTWS
jgi:large subunit ribosomal protein L19